MSPPARLFAATAAAALAGGALAGCLGRAATPPPAQRATEFRLGETFARTVTSADIDRAHARKPQCDGCPVPTTGRWTTKVIGAKIAFTSPDGSAGTITLTRIGGLLESPANTQLCTDPNGDSFGGRGRYRIKRERRVVTVIKVSDGCRTRAAVMTGTWHKVGTKLTASG